MLYFYLHRYSGVKAAASCEVGSLCSWFKHKTRLVCQGCVYHGTDNANWIKEQPWLNHRAEVTSAGVNHLF